MLTRSIDLADMRNAVGLSCQRDLRPMGVIIDTSVQMKTSNAATRSRPMWPPPPVRNPCKLPLPVIAELEYGVQRNHSPCSNSTGVLRAVSRMSKKHCLSLDNKGTSVVFGRLAAELDSRGTPATYWVQDLWLAALAMWHNLGILTQNQRNLNSIPGLRVMVVPA